MRKAFNFYRSYYDVALLLPELERAEFLMCICHAQFTGELMEPKMPIAKLAYIGQLHSIKKQLEGYNYGLKTPKKTDPNNEPKKEPSKGAYKSPLKEPLSQEQVQVQEKEEYTISFEALLQYINESFGRSFQVVNDGVKRKYNSLLKQGYKKDQVLKAINNCKNDSFHRDSNYKYCTPEYFSRPATIDKYADVSKYNMNLVMNHPRIID